MVMCDWESETYAIVVTTSLMKESQRAQRTGKSTQNWDTKQKDDQDTRTMIKEGSYWKPNFMNRNAYRQKLILMIREVNEKNLINGKKLKIQRAKYIQKGWLSKLSLLVGEENLSYVPGRRCWCNFSRG